MTAIPDPANLPPDLLRERRFICWKEELRGEKATKIPIVFRDREEVQAKRGRLVRADGDFIVLRTLHHTYVIRTSEILKLQDAEKGG